MIKVLEENEVPRAQVKCSNCGSLLEYGNADLSEDWKNRPDSYIASANNHAFRNYVLRCPVCGCEVSASWVVKKEK